MNKGVIRPRMLFALKLLEDKGWKIDWDTKEIEQCPVYGRRFNFEGK
ncbi:MAG: hypothetical protein OIN83_00805 [Candidatus Methanoperedens sp.]|nr:hypothetical protein [Candidatus Methanoperedens sp.]